MRREYRGRPRSKNTQRFPYEPLVMGGRLVMPAELQKSIAPSWTGLRLPTTCGLWWRGAGPNWWPCYPPGKQHRMDNGILIAAAIVCPIALYLLLTAKR